jgi:uncharacterized membrane protein (DUF441 family)
MVEFTHMFWITSITKVVALLVGGFVVYLAYRGYRRNASKPLLYAALGFSLITAGTIAEGVLFVLLGFELLAAVAIGTAVTIAGFVAIIYSIYSVK